MDKLTEFVNNLKQQEIEYTLECGVQGTIVHYNKGAQFFAHFEETKQAQKTFTVDNPDIGT